MEPGGWSRRAATLAGGIFGLQLGVIGAFLSPQGPSWLSVGALATLVGLPLGCSYGARCVGTRAAAVAPVGGWAAAVLVLLSVLPGGDLVVLSNLQGLEFLAAGLLVGPVVCARVKVTP